MTPLHLPDEKRPPNQGPRRAAHNREALIAAAREVFAEHGLDAPLSAIARRAGVGQGVLYRHFPDRASVASAVLEENVRQIEEAAVVTGARLADVLGVLTWHLTESAAFVGLLHAHGVVGRPDDLPYATALSERVEKTLRALVPRGHRLGGGSELMLAVAMVSGTVTGPTRAARERRAVAAWHLLGVEVGPVGPFDTYPRPRED